MLALALATRYSNFMDSISPDKRSWVMSRVRNKDTGPEKKARSLLHRMGYRFRLHKRDLPGNPDIVLPKYNAVIFVHGCFWHRHDCKCGNRMPKSRVKFWNDKLEGNRKSDKLIQEALKERGWKVFVVWECMLKDEAALRAELTKFLTIST